MIIESWRQLNPYKFQNPAGGTPDQNKLNWFIMFHQGKHYVHEWAAQMNELWGDWPCAHDKPNCGHYHFGLNTEVLMSDLCHTGSSYCHIVQCDFFVFVLCSVPTINTCEFVGNVKTMLMGNENTCCLAKMLVLAAVWTQVFKEQDRKAISYDSASFAAKEQYASSLTFTHSGAINLSHGCLIYSLLCAWNGFTIIFRKLFWCIPGNAVFVSIITMQSMMHTHIRINYGLQVIFFCLHNTHSTLYMYYYRNYKDVSEGIEHIIYTLAISIMSNVCLRFSKSFKSSFVL